MNYNYPEDYKPKDLRDAITGLGCCPTPGSFHIDLETEAIPLDLLSQYCPSLTKLGFCCCMSYSGLLRGLRNLGHFTIDDSVNSEVVLDSSQAFLIPIDFAKSIKSMQITCYSNGPLANPYFSRRSIDAFPNLTRLKLSPLTSSVFNILQSSRLPNLRAFTTVLHENSAITLRAASQVLNSYCCSRLQILSSIVEPSRDIRGLITTSLKRSFQIFRIHLNTCISCWD